MSDNEEGSSSSDNSPNEGKSATTHQHRSDDTNITHRQPKKMRRSIVTDHEKMTFDISKTNVKSPPFSPDDPEIWFAVLEGQFASHGITDDAVKFNNVITKLDMVHAKAVKDIIINPPAKNRYEKIKTELIRRLTASQEKKVRQLLTHEEIGDRKASQFLRHLQDLAGPSIPEDFLRTIWSNRLPSHIQTVLASQPFQDLEQLANLADRIQEITSPCGNVAAAARPSTSAESTSSTSGEIAELKKMVERLALKLDQHTRESRPQRRGNFNQQRRRSTSRSKTRSASNYRQFPICWYHHVYKSGARNCQTPCDFKKSGNDTGNQQ